MKEAIKKFKYYIIGGTAVLLVFVLYLCYNEGLEDNDFDVLVSFDDVYLTLTTAAKITGWEGTDKGEVKLVPFNDTVNVKLNGKKDAVYSFSVRDGEIDYNFGYSFNKEDNTINFNLLSD